MLTESTNRDIAANKPVIFAGGPHLRQLLHSLCEHRGIPSVVTDLIAEYIDQRDLLTISLLSPELHNQADSVLHSNVILDFDDLATAGRKATLLLRTLLTSKTAGKSIRSVRLTGDPLSQWRNKIPPDSEGVETHLRGQTPPDTLLDLSAFAPKEIELYRARTDSFPVTLCSSTSQIPLPELCASIIGLIPHLQDLQINSDYFRFPNFRKSLTRLFNSGHFKDLKNSSFGLDLIKGKRRHITAVREWDEALLTPFLAVNIASAEAVMTLRPEAIRQMRVSSITRLVLYHCQVQDFDLNALLASTPQLCYLEYHASVDYAWYTSPRWKAIGAESKLGLEPLLDSLRHVRDSLKDLVMSQEFNEDSLHFQWGYGAGHEPPFHQRDDMSKLRHLYSLSIPYAYLLGWKCREDQDWQWHKILPPSLCQITLTDHLSENFMADGWTDESLMPVISSLLSWLASVRKGEQPIKFSLLLLQSSTDFNEPVRERLALLCEEHGISCSIKKLQKDRARSPKMTLQRGRGASHGRGHNQGQTMHRS